MLKWFKSIFFGRELFDVLNETKKVRVNGIRFIIRKINILNYVDGSNIIRQSYDTYKIGKSDGTNSQVSQEKINEYLCQVLVAGVAHPKLSFNKEGPGLFVEDLLVDGDMVEKLHEHILWFTYGKKKMKQNISAQKDSDTLIRSQSATA